MLVFRYIRHQRKGFPVPSYLPVGSRPGFPIQNQVANYIGVHKDAKAEWDRYDHVEPPLVGEYVSVRFPHRDWEKYAYDYTVDMRPPGLLVSWDFDVITTVPRKTVTIKLDGTELLPGHMQITLVNRDRKSAILLENDTFSFESGKGLTERHYQVIVSDSSIEHPELQQLNTEPFVVARSFPNPFNSSATIKYTISEPGRVVITVYNALGQKVRTFDKGHKEIGSYDLRFEAKELTTGLYLYKVDAGFASTTGKMLYMR